MPRLTFSYKNDDIKVIWKPALCIHSRLCWVQLRSVFNPTKKPWINMAGAETERIVQQVKKCPSRALEFEWLNEQAAQVSEKQIVEESKDDLTANGNVPVIICEPHGPLVINGIIRIKHSDGRETTEENVRLCSCGSSKKKPYCDGSHETDGFSE